MSSKVFSPPLFFFFSLAKALSALFIFSKNQLLILFIFSIIYIVFISFTSVLIFVVPSLLTLGLVILFLFP